jgi:hypothetical protein
MVSPRECHRSAADVVFSVMASPDGLALRPLWQVHVRIPGSFTG